MHHCNIFEVAGPREDYMGRAYPGRNIEVQHKKILTEIPCV